MRIRKRWPPPPPPPDLLSSTLSDHYNITLTTPPIQSLLPTSFKQNHHTSWTTCYPMHLNQNPSIGWEDNEKKLITSDQRTDQHQNVETSAGSSISSSFSNQVIGVWCEENKVIPIKKRRGSLKSEEMVMEREEMKKKKWGDDVVDSAAKKSSEGGDEKILVVQEGGWGSGSGSSSRCTRANGTGWRCCQPSVVGYSLCEHHRTLNSLGRIRRKKVSSTWEWKKKGYING